MLALKNCVSCGRQTKSYTEFPCPHCGSTRIIRCQSCREILNPYRCGSCGKEGP